MIRVIGPRDKRSGTEYVVNSTSSSKEDWSRQLSPFFLGPVDLYSGLKSLNVENAWQYSKVYKHHLDREGNPSSEYWRWAKAGWGKQWADRYPAGKGAIPAYSLWENKKLDYIEARKQIYIPLYQKACFSTPQFQQLLKEYVQRGSITIFDFDGYDHHKLGMSLDEVLNCPYRKMGHGFVLAMMIESASLLRKV